VEYKMNVFAGALGHEYLNVNCDSCGIGLDESSDETLATLVEIGNKIYEKNKYKLLSFFNNSQQPR
jgi:hypothetical protein